MFRIDTESNKQYNIIEDIYCIHEDNMYIVEKHEELVKELAEIKRGFILQCDKLDKLTMVNSFFSDVLLYSEIETKKDLSLYSYEEIIDLIKHLGELGIFTSLSKIMSYCRIIWAYTEWAYISFIRSDYVTTRDITSSINPNEVMIEKQPLTRNEMYDLILGVEREDVKLGILGLLEGLKLSELLLLTKFNVLGENHELQLETRTFKCSDKLYDMLKEYANKTIIERRFRFGKYESGLYETDYIIRPTLNKRNVENEPVKMSAFIATMKKELNFINISTNDIRNYAILNDIIDNVDVTEINRKYGLKVKYYSILIRDKKGFEKLKEKRMLEKEIG